MNPAPQYRRMSRRSAAPFATNWIGRQQPFGFAWDGARAVSSAVAHSGKPSRISDVMSSNADARSFRSWPMRLNRLSLGALRTSRRSYDSMITHKGGCFCGAVEIETKGAPEAMGYCHCSSCRSWSASPVNAFTLWKPENVRVTKGEEFLAKFMKTEASNRRYCKRCGGHLMNEHPQLGLVDVYAATIPTLKFSPGVHVNYAETVLPMKDGLPKLKDFPAELGGSGIAVPE